jgi:hypothetical protein
MVMDWIQVHVAISQLPVMGVLIVATFLGLGVLMKNEVMQRTALGMMALMGLFVLAVYMTGGQAEVGAKAIGGFNGREFYEHRQQSNFAFVAALALTLVAAAGFVGWRTPKIATWASRGVLALALASMATLGLSSHTGGKMRHGENPGALPYPHLYLSPGVVPEGGTYDSMYEQYHQHTGDGHDH